MEASAGLVAGSHNRNELVVIHGHEEGVQGWRKMKMRKIFDDIEHEFKVDDEQNKSRLIVETILHGKMTYGRGPEDEDSVQYPPVIAGTHSHPVSGEFPISTHGNGEQTLGSSLHKRIHPFPASESGSARWDDKKEGGWKERMDEWKMQQGHMGQDYDDSADPDMATADEARQPLSRKVPIASSKINPYRMVIVARLVILSIFFRYRTLNPVHDAIGLWLTSIICEIWFSFSWILDQFPKWFPIDHETYLDRLSLEREGEPNMLAPVDIFVSTVDPMKEPPLVTANTILSILAMDYPVEKISCYLSDDGASMCTFEALSETAEFARKWVPFCKKFAIEPRAPEFYFSLKIDYLKDKVQPTFVKERRAMKIRISGVLTNAPFMLNLDCDHYINNSKAAREAMCFLMDPQMGKKVCFVQFPQRFDGIDRMCLRRQVLYVYNPPKRAKRPRMVSCDRFDDDNELSQMNFEKNFGQSAIFVTSTLMIEGGVPPSTSPAALLKEAIHVITCGYEDKTEWGLELGWIYGSITEDILTGFKMHCRGWRSVYCMPKVAAFKGSAPINLSDRLNQVLRWALGSVEIFFSRHSPAWYGYKGGKLKWLERLSYINTTVYPFTSLPLLAYCTLPAVCLLTGKFIMFLKGHKENYECFYHYWHLCSYYINTFTSIFFIALFLSIFATGILELRWSGVSIEEWWRNEQFWVIGGVSAHLFAVVQGLLKILAGIDTNFTVTSKATDDEDFGELYAFKWTTLLIPPTTILIINLVGVVAGISDAINNGYNSWGPLFGKLFFAFWVIAHLTPTIVVIWSILLASIFSLLWVRIDPFVHKTKGPDVKQCGVNC
ncbi:unnamed protein product [Withania somnifera]